MRDSFWEEGKAADRRNRPYIFTEHGAIMAANVLNSRRAVQMAVGACPKRSRMGRPRLSENASIARRQTRASSKTCLVRKGIEEAAGRPRSRHR
jgi:hypothetical protein